MHALTVLTCPGCTAGNIAVWNKKEGDSVAAGDSIADIETDKATMTWEAQDEGFVAKILVQAGSPDVQVGAPVAVFVEEQVGCWRQQGSSSLVVGSFGPSNGF